MTDTLQMPAFLDRRPLVFTYTSLNTYENICPHQMYRRYVKKDVPYVETPAMAHGNRVHSAFELRIGGGKPLPADFAQWERFAAPFDGRGAKCELKASITAKGEPCDYFAKDAWLRVRVDVAILHETVGYIMDIKTGNSKYEDPYEIALGALILKARHPALKTVKGNYLWLKEDRVGQIHDLSDFRATWLKTKDIAAKIEADRTTGHFEKRQSGLCLWCDVMDCENNRKSK